LKAGTTDQRVILKARVIDGDAVMKAKEEKARQAEAEAHRAAAWAEVKEQHTAVRVEAAKVKAARAVANKAKGKGKTAAVADAPVTSPKQSRQPRKILVSKSQIVVGDVGLTVPGVVASPS